MTVSSTTRRAGPYPGNGVATSFPFSFKVFAKTDIAVVFANASGVESTLVLDSDYSVTLNADQNANPGGSITYPIIGSPMLSTQALAIVGALDYSQTTALPNGGAYNASIVERALDRIVILAQQLKETVNRGVQLGFTTASNVSSRLPAPRALSVLGWASDEKSLTNLDASALGITISYANWRNKTFDGTGALTAFVLDTDAGVSTNCDVSVGGLAQTADVNFSYDSATKTVNFLTGAPPAGTNNVVVRYGQALPQGTMTSAGITDSTSLGRSLLTAVSAAVARALLGAAEIGANATITALNALASVPSVISAAIPQIARRRQTILAGSSTRIQIGTGLACNLLATATPVRYSFAAGIGANGEIDYVGTVSADVTGFWSGLTANVVNYLFVDRNPTTGALTGIASTLPYIAQDSSASISVVSGQHTYVHDTGQMYVGNGSVATAVQRTADGECLAGASTITSVTSYAKMGRASTVVSSLALGTAYSFSHNIGVKDLIVSGYYENKITEGGWAVGDRLYHSMLAGNTNSSIGSDARTATLNTGSTVIGQYHPKTGGGITSMTTANWSIGYSISRAW